MSSPTPEQRCLFCNAYVNECLCTKAPTSDEALERSRDERLTRHERSAGRKPKIKVLGSFGVRRVRTVCGGQVTSREGDPT
jgi:hypothetical protein